MLLFAAAIGAGVGMYNAARRHADERRAQKGDQSEEVCRIEDGAHRADEVDDLPAAIVRAMATGGGGNRGVVAAARSVEFSTRDARGDGANPADSVRFLVHHGVAYS